MSVEPPRAASSIAFLMSGRIASNTPSPSARPRAWTSGPDTTEPLVESTTANTETKPSSDRIRRSLSSVSVISPTDEPSTYTLCTSTAPTTRATPSLRSTTVPFSANITLSCGTPVRIARCPFASRWRTSPWIGMTLRGRRML